MKKRFWLAFGAMTQRAYTNYIYSDDSSYIIVYINCRASSWVSCPHKIEIEYIQLLFVLYTPYIQLQLHSKYVLLLS